MSIRIHVFNHVEKRDATVEEIESLIVNPITDGRGFADVDFKCSHGLAIDSDSSDLTVTVVSGRLGVLAMSGRARPFFAAR